MENPSANDFAEKVMALNRRDRRVFQKKERLPFKVAGSNKPFRKHEHPKTKESS